MSYARKNIRQVTGSIVGVLAVAAIATWQFYLFVTFKVTSGMQAGTAGTGHLWWAIAMSVLACGATFLVFSVFVRHDTDDERYITATRRG